MGSFFQISGLFFELVTIFLNNRGVGVMQARWGAIIAEQHAF